MSCAVIRMKFPCAMTGRSTIARATTTGLLQQGLRALLVVPSRPHVCAVERRYPELRGSVVSRSQVMELVTTTDVSAVVVDDVRECRLSEDDLRELAERLARFPISQLLLLS